MKVLLLFSICVITMVWCEKDTVHPPEVCDYFGEFFASQSSKVMGTNRVISKDDEGDVDCDYHLEIGGKGDTVNCDYHAAMDVGPPPRDEF